MPAFRCVAIPTQVAERFRRTGLDDRGQPVHRRVVDGPGFPCRHCLALGEPGEVMLLASYDLPHPQGVYWTPSPIFLHERACPRFEATDEIAPIVLANGIVSYQRHEALTRAEAPNGARGLCRVSQGSRRLLPGD